MDILMNNLPNSLLKTQNNLHNKPLKLINFGRHLMSHISIFLVIIVIFFSSLFSYIAPVKATNTMQCMSNCIKYDGQTAKTKAACKSRCANIKLPPAYVETPLSCMLIFKKCKRACDKSNKVCWRECKEALMQCK